MSEQTEWSIRKVDNVRESGRPEAIEIYCGETCVCSFHEEEDTFEGVSLADMEFAEYIVRACNAFLALVDAYKAYRALMKRIDAGEDDNVTVMDWRLLDGKIKAALVAAGQD
jgi:hypothetical protein